MKSNRVKSARPVWTSFFVAFVLTFSQLSCCAAQHIHLFGSTYFAYVIVMCSPAVPAPLLLLQPFR